jgi:hypothetical protein
MLLRRAWMFPHILRRAATLGKEAGTKLGVAECSSFDSRNCVAFIRDWQFVLLCRSASGS